MANQNWASDDYKTIGDYQYELGGPVIELLAPKSGEKILDLGCGDGKLTKEVVDLGCDVIGIDANPEMVESAKALGIDARVKDAEHLHMDERFDAVMSNASLHWMADHYGVVRGIWHVLKPGGRFSAECGGEGCIRIIREGLKLALIKRGLDYKARNPWKYPELGTFSDILENQGFKINYIARINRPTPLPKGLKSWLEVFAKSHTKGFSEEDKRSFYKDVEKYCRPLLYTEEKGWFADHVRLRILAEKPLKA
ncbi:MAG: class I SAM-dependent methyltransferase [Synergistaceae bacterium]|nr:class I SAM-dependent methyltransferase [Synergistaceae bacterium]